MPVFILISVLLVWRVVVDDGKDGDTSAVHHGNNGIIGGWFDGLDVFGEAVFDEKFHFAFENVLVVKTEKFFVCEIDAKLFKAVIFEVFKPEDVKNVDRLEATDVGWTQFELDFLQNKLKD
jgi:hypothetical protein